MAMLPADQDPDVARRQAKAAATLAKKSEATQADKLSGKRKVKKRRSNDAA